MEQPTAQREGYGNAVLMELPDPQSHLPAPKGTVRKVIFFICHSVRMFFFFPGREMSSLLLDRDKFSKNKYMIQMSSMTWQPGSSGLPKQLRPGDHVHSPLTRPLRDMVLTLKGVAGKSCCTLAAGGV